jgi:hypothetical protein
MKDLSATRTVVHANGPPSCLPVLLMLVLALPAARASLIIRVQERVAYNTVHL